MERAGWHGLDQIFREYPLRAGRVVVRVAKAQRDKSTVLRADYALFYKTNIPLAVVEAKDNHHAVGAGSRPDKHISITYWRPDVARDFGLLFETMSGRMERGDDHPAPDLPMPKRGA